MRTRGLALIGSSVALLQSFHALYIYQNSKSSAKTSTDVLDSLFVNYRFEH